MYCTLNKKSADVNGIIQKAVSMLRYSIQQDDL